MKLAVFAFLGIALAAVIAWAFSVFVLHLNWEIGLLVIQISSFIGCIVGGYIGHRLTNSSKRH